MPELQLTENDLARLAAALAPLLVPFIRNDIGQIFGAVREVASADDILAGDFDTDSVIAAVLDHIRASDENRCADLEPLTLGSVKGI